VSTEAVGLGGLKTYVELAGKQATVRLNRGQAGVFLMAIDGMGVGATYDSISSTGGGSMQWTALYKLDADKKNREVPQMNITGYGPISKKTTEASRRIPLNFSRYDEHTVRIETQGPLPAGEYAFVGPLSSPNPNGSQNQLYYCFGIN
jgi:hypothetical protein